MVAPALKYSPWTNERANSWQLTSPWFVGCNYCPSYAVNQLEMWQQSTFDIECIWRELSWARAIGFNSLRVFLHDIAWSQNQEGFIARLDRFLEVANYNGMGVVPVFFDSVWHPEPRAGRQRDPEPFVHNSGWLQSPGVSTLRDTTKFSGLEDYITSIVTRFRRDPRVHAWDVWNEPDNNNSQCYGARDIVEGKADIVLPLLAKTFDWVRACKPLQPVTSAVWWGDWHDDDRLPALQRMQIEASDVVSFHQYAPLSRTAEVVGQLSWTNKPLLCTEYMARGVGSTFSEILPFFKEKKIGAYSWGLVKGRTQTHMPWNSWQQRYESDPAPWFHDVFHADGTSYSEEETTTIRRLTL